jgi:hypothetical protein
MSAVVLAAHAKRQEQGQASLILYQKLANVCGQRFWS